jgi:hypothetical protein
MDGASPPMRSAAFLDPMATSSPRFPRLSAPRRSASRSASPFPKRRSTPSNSASPAMPLSRHSMRNATVPPADMVSMPVSSQIRAARRITSLSGIPQSGPRAKRDSYSSLPPAPEASSKTCSQPMVQAAQEARWTFPPAARASPEIRSAPANSVSEKFRVGRARRRLRTRTLATVPSSRYLRVAGPKERAERSRAAATTPSGAATGTRPVPRTATAFTFFAARTAPSPPRPAWRPSFPRFAKRTPLSPAGPQATTRWPGNRSAVAEGDRPASSGIGRTSTSPSRRNTTERTGARPRTTRASTPARLSSMAKWLEERESVMRRVRGLLATTANLALVVRGVPTSGDPQKTMGASGASGFTPRGASRQRRSAPSPAPPMKARRSAGSSTTDSPTPLPASTRMYRPW